MRTPLIAAAGVLLAALAHAQPTADGPFDASNPITLNGAVAGISSWSGTRGPETFLVFEVPDRAGRPLPWATRVAATMFVQRGEPVRVTGFAPKKDATLADLVPFSAVPMLTPIARAHRVIRATEIRRADGTPLVAPASAAQTPSPIFRITTDEFWLNLHHFLYVLGRAEARTGDSNREAVAAAPAEAERGMSGLTADERKTWGEAVTAYATGLSLKDAVRESPFPELTAALAAAADASTLVNPAIDQSARSVLERAAPIYRKAWWPAHRSANLKWKSSIESRVAAHGETILGFITKIYGMEWPAAGYSVHASGYSNFGGAYSSVRGVLVISSLAESSQGFKGLESIFHEGMHQWDGQVYRALGTQANLLKAPVPVDMPHALIWVTAGEAVRRVEASHIRLVDAMGIWDLRSSGAPGPLRRLKAPLEDQWQPYLDGRGTRDEAMKALLEQIAASR